MIPFGIGRGTTFADQENLGRLVDRQVLARLAGFLRPHWRRLTIAIVTMFAYTAAAVAVPWLVRLAIDSYIQAKDLSGLDLLFVIFLIVASLGAVGYYLHQRMLQYVSQQVLYSLRVRMFNHLQKLSMSYYDRNEAGQIMSRVQNDVQQLQGATATIIFSLADVISLGGVVAAMFVMSPRLAVITLLVIIPLTAVLTIWQRVCSRGISPCAGDYCRA